VLAAALLAAAPPAVDVPREVRRDLTGALDRWVRELLAQRNQDGLTYRRGSYSHSFHRADDATYRVTLHEDTASRDRLHTERSLATLRRQPDGGWTLAEREVQDTYDGLVRPYPGDERCYRFDSFALRLEGWALTAANGSLYTDDLDGEPYRITLVADRTYQKFTPPDSVGAPGRATWDYLVDRTPDKFDFEPERVELTCSPRECRELLSTVFGGLRPVACQDTHEALRKALEDSRRAQLQELRADGFRGFTTPFEPGRRFTAIVAKGNGADDRLWLVHDSWDGWDVKLGATEYGTFLGYYSEDTLRSGALPGELERRDDPDARDFDLREVRGTVELALRDHSTMTGDVSFRLVTQRALRELRFAVARMRPRGGARAELRDPSLVINSIQDGSGRELTWVRTDPLGGVVVLPAQTPPGTQVELRVQFENQGAIYKLSPSYSRLARGGWLPFVRFADPLERLDLVVRVPAKYKALGIGERVEESSDGRVTTTRWVARGPVSFPTIIFGDYVERQPGFQARRADGTPIQVSIHVDRDGMVDWNIRPKQLRPLAEQAANSLNLFREMFGVEYAHAKLDLVNDPLGLLYGQSPASIVYLGSAAFRGEGTLVAALGPWTMKSARSLVAHEVAHQWWGGTITHANERNYWFVESLAEYASALYMEASQGRDDPGKGWRAYLDEVEAWRKQVGFADLFGSVQAATAVNSGDYRAALYARGPYAFHMLRMTFGDEKFFAFLRALAQELSGERVVTRDIQEVAEREFGTPMDWFFDQWIRGVGLPELDLTWDSRATEDGTHLIEGRLTQRVVVGSRRRVFEGVPFRGLVAVAAIGKRSGREYPLRLAVEGPETSFTLRVPEEPVDLVLNPNGEMLARKATVRRAGEE
jgi:hypothetical protein